MCGNPERTQKQASEGRESKKLGPYHVWKPWKGPKTSKWRTRIQEIGPISCVEALKGPKNKQVKDENPRNWALIMCGSPGRAQKQASEGREPKKLGPYHVWKPWKGPKTSKWRTRTQEIGPISCVEALEGPKNKQVKDKWSQSWSNYWAGKYYGFLQEKVIDQRLYICNI